MSEATPYCPSLSFCTDALIQHRYSAIINNADRGVLRRFYRQFFMRQDRALRLLGLVACAQYLSGKTVSNDALQTLDHHGCLKNFLLLSSLAADRADASLTQEALESAKLYASLTADHSCFDQFVRDRRDARWAIVGNAPIQPEYLNYSKGSEIDSADVVVRFNNFKTKGYEVHIGDRTDLHARISNISAVHVGIPIVLTDDPVRHFLQDEALHGLRHAEVYNFSASEEETFACKFKSIPSSGFKLLWILHQFGCKNVHVYGFSFLNASRMPTSFEHYFEKTKKERLHDIADEITLLRKIYNQDF